jgi:hypothetical protein
MPVTKESASSLYQRLPPPAKRSSPSFLHGDGERHSRSHQIRPRLRHEGRVQAVALRHGADRRAKCLNLVRDADALALAEDDRVLARRRLVVRGLDLESHLLQRQNHVAARVLALVQRSDVQISGALAGERRRPAVLIVLKQEKFTVRLQIKAVSFPGRPAHRVHEDGSETLPRIGSPFSSFRRHSKRATLPCCGLHGRIANVSKSG